MFLTCKLTKNIKNIFFSLVNSSINYDCDGYVSRKIYTCILIKIKFNIEHPLHQRSAEISQSIKACLTIKSTSSSISKLQTTTICWAFGEPYRIVKLSPLCNLQILPHRTESKQRINQKQQSNFKTQKRNSTFSQSKTTWK